MPGKNSKKMIGACVVTAALLCAPSALKAEGMLSHYTCVADAIQKDNRPEPAKRLFRSQAVENEIIRVQKLLRNSKLAWMFTNCFPNTLDTTVHFRKGKDGKPDTLYIQEIFMPCGSVTRGLRYGLMYNWPIPIRN